MRYLKYTNNSSVLKPMYQLSRWVVFIAMFYCMPELIIAQQGTEIPLGTWRDHLPMANGIALAQSEQKVFSASPNGLLIYNRDDNTVEKLSRSNGLSDIGISWLDYHKATNTLIISYANGNIDFLQDNRVTNFSDIKRAGSILGSKSIYRVRIDGNTAYFCCNFGIVTVDLIKREVRSTILPSLTKPETFDIAFSEDSLYIATAAGVFKANKEDKTLPYYIAWTPVSAFGTSKYYHIALFEESIFAVAYNAGDASENLLRLNKNATLTQGISAGYDYADLRVSGGRLFIASNDGLRTYKSTAEGGGEENLFSYSADLKHPEINAAFRDDTDPNIFWIADKNYCLIKSYGLYDFQPFMIEGPYSSNVFAMTSNLRNIWVAPGSYDGAYSPTYKVDGVLMYNKGNWERYELKFPEYIRDIVSIAVDPTQAGHIFACSWGNGVAELKNGAVVNNYTETNSTLQGYIGIQKDLRISGAAFDKKANLWVANSGVTKPISLRNASGEWRSFGFSSDINNSQTGPVMVDSSGQKWVILQEKGLLVFRTDEDNNLAGYKRLTSATGQGGLSTDFVLSMATDRDGLIWVGTSKGVSVFYSPDFILETGADNWDSQRITVSQGGFNQYLLDAEEVSAICVDGANRKWLGTKKAGLFLVSPDGTSQLAHFNVENSPILSNTINSLSIDGETGELFIGTDRGICSYRTDATTGATGFGKVYAFPNPVRPDYHGVITINGMVTDADVKITDVSGNLVYQTVANGGTATWNGLLYSGKRAATGVYLVFCTNADGSQTKVTKILFVN